MVANPKNQKIWIKAKNKFISSYNKSPISPSDYRITMSIYKDLGGNISVEKHLSIEKPISRSVAQKLFGNPSKLVNVR